MAVGGRSGLQVLVADPLEGVVAVEVVGAQVAGGAGVADAPQADGGELALQGGREGGLDPGARPRDPPHEVASYSPRV